MRLKTDFIPLDLVLKIKILLKSLLSDYYHKVIEREREICSFGIFTDSDMSGFVIRYNTQEGIEKIIESAIKSREDYPDWNWEGALDDSKWWIPEWISESKGDELIYYNDKRYDELDKIMNDLRKKTWMNENDEVFASYKEEMFDIMCKSLEELKGEGLFRNVSENFYLLVQEQDNGIYGNRDKSLQRILTPEQYKEYEDFDNTPYE